MVFPIIPFNSASVPKADNQNKSTTPSIDWSRVAYYSALAAGLTLVAYNKDSLAEFVNRAYSYVTIQNNVSTSVKDIFNPILCLSKWFFPPALPPSEYRYSNLLLAGPAGKIDVICSNNPSLLDHSVFSPLSPIAGDLASSSYLSEGAAQDLLQNSGSLCKVHYRRLLSQSYFNFPTNEASNALGIKKIEAVPEAFNFYIEGEKIPDWVTATSKIRNFLLHGSEELYPKTDHNNYLNEIS